MQEIELKDLTEATVAGTGVFDVLMRAARSHLDEEFTRNRIKGPEYANVYLGSIEPVLVQSVQFLLNKDKAKNESDLIAAQIRETEAKVLLVHAQTELAKQQKLNAENEWLLLAEQKAKMIAETALILQQKDNLEEEKLLLADQKAKLKAETALIGQNNLNAENEWLLLAEQKTKLIADTTLIKQQKENLAATLPQITAQTSLITQQRLNVITEELMMRKQMSKLDIESALITQQKENLAITVPQIVGQTALIAQQRLNTITEELVMHKQMCKLDAEFDLIMGQVNKTVTESGLLAQKIQTEKAQTTGAGTTEDSVIGKQKTLYQAQADGFKRNAEQSAAKLMIDSWNTRRMTDEGTVADSLNQLNDSNVGRTVSKLMSGIGA